MSACKKSAYLNKLGSNIVYVGRSNSKYQCPDSFCAELGSPMRPVDNLEDTLRIIEKKFATETPVTISFSPGDYESETFSESLIIPRNVVGLICSEGTTKLKNNLMVKNVEKLEIQNIDLVGNLEIIGEGSHKGKVSWKNGNLYGTYKYTVKESAVQSFIMEKVDQLVTDDMDGPYDNIVAVSGNGTATILLNQYTLHSRFKGKIHMFDSGKVTRKSENCVITHGGEDIQIKENAVIDYIEKDNEIRKHVDSIEEYLKINVIDSGRINIRRCRTLSEGSIEDGFFWFDQSTQDNGVLDIYCESNRWNLSGLGGYSKFVGRDKSRRIVNIFQDSINMSRNDELRPIFKRILNDSCSCEHNSSNYSVDSPSHYYEHIHNDNSKYKVTANTVKYTIGGFHQTCCHDSIFEADYKNSSLFSDENIGYYEKTIQNNNSMVSKKLTNSVTKVCNDGIHSIFYLEQNGSSVNIWSGFNTNCEYKLENYCTNVDENNKPAVYRDVISDSSKLSTSSKENNVKILSGKNCNGVLNENLKDKSDCSKSCTNSNIEIILADDNAVGMNIQMMHNTLRVMNEDNQSIIQKRGIYFKNVQNDDCKFEFNSHKQSIKHQCHQNGKTIDHVLNQNAELCILKSFPNIESDGTIWDMVTNDNSKMWRNIRGGKASGKEKLAKLQSNHNSVQQIKLFETDLSTVNNDLLEIDGNEKDDISFNNCQFSGNFLAKKVSNLDIQNTSIHGVLHAVQCGKIESNNSSHVGLNNQSPIVLENTSICNIQSSKMETTSSTPHIQTKTDGNCKVNLKGVNFVDTTEENSSLACIETDGKGQTICEVGTCNSKRSKFLSAKSKQDGRSTTTFSRNNEFGSDGLDPTVDGQVTEASTSLVIQNGSLVSTPEDDCGPNEDEIQIIPRNVSDVPYFTMYYCLALPEYDYFVSSSISFKDIIDSYQSKDAKSGCFTATSVRCMTDENGDPMDGMYIMIEGVRTPNDKNALQTDKDGNIIDRNLKDSLYMEKYHITKIDPITKRSVAQLGGNLQYTDGSGTGATTCIPRLIFPIHYASGEWTPLEKGYIEWNYDNKKETDYKRELRFFSR